MTRKSNWCEQICFNIDADDYHTEIMRSDLNGKNMITIVSPGSTLSSQ